MTAGTSVTLIHWDAGDTYGTSSDNLLGYWACSGAAPSITTTSAKAAGCPASKSKPGNLKSAPNTARGAVTGSSPPSALTSPDCHRLAGAIHSPDAVHRQRHGRHTERQRAAGRDQALAAFAVATEPPAAENQGKIPADRPQMQYPCGSLRCSIFQTRSTPREEIMSQPALQPRAARRSRWLARNGRPSSCNA